MPKGYHHLTYAQRCQIAALKNRGDSVKEIAKALGTDRSTIYKELNRNGDNGHYDYELAEKKAKERVKKAHGKIISVKILTAVGGYLQMRWSPQQIAGRMKKEGLGFISHETIYKHVWMDKKQGGVLYKELRHHGKKYNKRSKGTAGRGCIPGRVDIKERPAIVEEKIRLGDWELDTIIGSNHKGVIVSIVDRATKYTKLIKVSSKSAEAVGEAIIKELGPIKDLVHTLTADNGKEFAKHLKIAEELNARMYFATPYHSWERGLNEHTNGLVRQYFPKSMELDKVSEERIKEVERALNSRPRRVLLFETPQEAFLRMSKAA